MITIYKYGILMYPSYNRVYFQTSKFLAISELEAANFRLPYPCEQIEHETIKGVDYITFNTVQPLDQDSLSIISRLSFVYALFYINQQQEYFFEPVEKKQEEYFEDDILTILKYSGKTNETFTKLMVNLGWLASDFYYDNNINLFDPMCGKGTTLFQGLVYGFNVFGVEIDKKSVQQCTSFLTRYLKTKKYKHKLSQRKMSENNKRLCEIYEYELAKTKEEYKSKNILAVKIVRGDTLNTSKFFKKNFAHLLVCDLPYGIQHGSSTTTGDFTRNPEKLLMDAIKQWYIILRHGGTLTLSWNTYVFKKEQLAHLLMESGFKVVSEHGFESFRHRVDQAIIRDIIVAKKSD
jgi:DNA modification methylase